MSKKLLLSFLFSIAYIATIAQTGTIRGFVYEKESGEPVLFTNVYVEGGPEDKIYGASTDVNGYFSITKVPPGEYT